MSPFDRAARFVLQQEGGLSDHAADRGGRTNWGVTQRLLDELQPGRRVDDLSMDDARAIFRAHFWDAVRGDELPEPLGLAMLDFAVNSGPRRAAVELQRVLGVVPDGVLGPKTFEALGRRDARWVAFELCRRRAIFLAELCHRLPSQLVFLKGWWLRTLEVLEEVHRA